MATDEQRARRRAQRATAERLKGKRYTPIIPSSTKAGARAARDAYANRVIAGIDERPAYGSREGSNLARLAALADVGKADPRYVAAFKDYWYHKNDESKNEADAEDADREDSSSADNDEE